jgi:hypothetical protein
MSIEKPAVSWAHGGRIGAARSIWTCGALKPRIFDAVGSWRFEAGPADQTWLPVAPSNRAGYSQWPSNTWEGTALAPMMTGRTKTEGAHHLRHSPQLCLPPLSVTLVIGSSPVYKAQRRRD